MLYRMLSAFDGFFGLFRYLWSPLMLLLRVHWGWLFFAAGYGKLMAIPQTVTNFTNLGIPFPEYMVYLVAIVEAVGGIFLLLGFMSRLAAFPLFVTMVVAYFTAHLGAVTGILGDIQLWASSIWNWSIGQTTPFSGFVAQAPFFFMVTTLLILMGGPGIFSLDKLIRNRVER